MVTWFCFKLLISKDLKMKYTIKKLGMFIIAITLLNSCESFVEVDLPNTEMTAEDVFQDKATAEAALIESYVNLRDQVLTAGTIGGMSNLMGMYSDELINLRIGSTAEQSFFTNNITPTDSSIQRMWNDSYKIIYQCNKVIEGVTQSTGITDSDKKQLIGEALFTRSLVHFYLVQLFNEIPYVTTTDYRINSKITKKSVSELYTSMINDVLKAELLLDDANSSNNTRPTKFATEALLARMYLYNKDYANALVYSNKVIDADFSLESSVNSVFLQESRSTIWSLKPAIEGANTNEAMIFIFTETPPTTRILNNNFVESFENGDLRKLYWIKELRSNTTPYFHAYKYKEKNATPSSKEYSVIFRLEEMYYIRIEANALLGNIDVALNDWNMLRTRYKIPNYTELPNDWQKKLLLERSHEFFCEIGHRFFDLKRTGNLTMELLKTKPNWKNHYEYLPIPQSELLLNPNMLPQNEGY